MKFISSFYRKIFNIIIGKTVPQKIFVFYIVMIILGTILLMLPISYTNSHNRLNFINSIFTAVSAISDTGLTIVKTGETFNFFGQLVVLLLIQIGGIGYMGLKVILLMFLGRKIGIREKLIISNEKGVGKLGGSKELIITAIKFVFLVEIVIMLAMFANFYFRYYNDVNVPFYRNFPKLIWYSIFHSVSAVNNAGFDLFYSSTSLGYFVSDYFFQTLILIGFIIGGLGFPVYYEVRNYLVARKKGEFFRFSLFTKFTMKVYFIVFFIGIFLVFISEMFSPNSLILGSSEYSFIDKAFIIIFNTSATRNAGFSTIDLNLFSTATQKIFIVLMWIGASPVSTGGGIRTTTFWIVILSIYCIATGKQTIKTHGRQIPIVTAIRSLVVALVSIFFIVFMLILILIFNHSQDLTFLSLLFEITSAFGTTGHSLGATRYLNSFDKILFITIMIIGQLGVSSTLLIFTNKKDLGAKNKIVFPEEDVIIG